MRLAEILYRNKQIEKGRSAALHDYADLIATMPKREFDQMLAQDTKFIAGQVKSMDDKSVCYGFYTALGSLAGNPYHKHSLTLLKPLSLAYRERMLEWFEYALLKRARAGGGGVGIKAVEKALKAFIEELPRLAQLGTNQNFSLRAFLMDREIAFNRDPNAKDENPYFDSRLLDMVGMRILKEVIRDAEKAGVMQAVRAAGFYVAAAKMSFPVVWDPKDKVWIIPPSKKTYSIKDQLGKQGYGFWWNTRKKRWQIKTLTPAIKQDFDFPDGDPSDQLGNWYWGTWYPKAAARLTKVFTEWASNINSSYTIKFPKARNGRVKFTRDIKNPDDAVEELRYRYIGRQGREPWLLVMDLFLELRRKSAPGKGLNHLLDRMNGLQHSNGLFLEQFPKRVFSWYRGFLNAKYHAPNAADLGKFIPDKDLKNLLLWIVGGTGKAKPVSVDQWQELQTRTDDYHERGKVEQPTGPNWRAKGYPRSPGAEQPDRLSDEVQRGLQRTTTKQRKEERERFIERHPFLADRWREKAKQGR